MQCSPEIHPSSGSKKQTNNAFNSCLIIAFRIWPHFSFQVSRERLESQSTKTRLSQVYFVYFFGWIEWKTYIVCTVYVYMYFLDEWQNKQETEKNRMEGPKAGSHVTTHTLNIALEAHKCTSSLSLSQEERPVWRLALTRSCESRWHLISHW